MQPKFLQEDLFTALQQPASGIAAAPTLPFAADLFAGLPLATPPANKKTLPPTAEPVATMTPASPVSTTETPHSPDIEKAPGAFKTISEAASALGVQQHVLRFWESRFSQIKPLKLAGGRRYYRPEDMDVLSKIQYLLYKKGYTIKGAQKAFHQEKTVPVQTTEKRHPEKRADAPTAATTTSKRLLTDKQRKQVSAIHQELTQLREVLRPYLAEAAVL